MLKNFFYHTRLVNEADDAPFEFPQGGELVEPHLSLALDYSKRVCFIDFSDEVGPALFNSLNNGVALFPWTLHPGSRSMRRSFSERRWTRSRKKGCDDEAGTHRGLDGPTRPAPTQVLGRRCTSIHPKQSANLKASYRTQGTNVQPV